jgi:hypothetical protein
MLLTLMLPTLILPSPIGLTPLPRALGSTAGKSLSKVLTDAIDK